MGEAKLHKQLLREALLACRDGEDTLSRSAADGRIKARLEALPFYHEAQTVFCYVSVGSEVDTLGLIEDLLVSGKSIFVPRCEGGGIMYAQMLLSLSELEKGLLGIPVPPLMNPRVESTSLDLIIVPCLACDTSGYRIGYGGGYYDRYLASAEQATSIALCRESLLHEHLPQEDHDVPVDFVITDERMIPGLIPGAFRDTKP